MDAERALMQMGQLGVKIALAAIKALLALLAWLAVHVVLPAFAALWRLILDNVSKAAAKAKAPEVANPFEGWKPAPVDLTEHQMALEAIDVESVSLDKGAQPAPVCVAAPKEPDADNELAAEPWWT